MTQHNLGNALRALGGRESDTERLEQAVVAYRAALEEYTRERAPLQWAATQNNLGAALQTLGGRESDMERLEQAVVAYRAALEERTSKTSRVSEPSFPSPGPQRGRRSNDPNDESYCGSGLNQRRRSSV